MTTKDFLRRVRLEHIEIARLNSKLEYLKKSTLPGGIRYDKDRVQTSPSDKISDIMVDIGDIEIELEADIKNLASDIVKARSLIRGLSSPLERCVLTMYYLPDMEQCEELPTWSDVAIALHYSKSRILHIHGEALQKINNSSK
jgi:hypothetical protein